MRTEAYFSKDRRYRYWLLRVWNAKLPVVGIIGVNPSKANERDNDHTIRKDIGFASRLHFGGLLKINVGAYCATDAREWRRVADPIGDENSVQHLLKYLEQFEVRTVIAAWGKNGNYFIGRCEAIVREIPNLFCLGMNDDGSPRHPARLPYSTPLIEFGRN